ncbi:MAG: hypothetical protein NZ570_03500 [Candidatus Caldarchaeum sp.]|nr:hypothetical protein [Candidatus Caldarchaeum sp.]MCS7136981.1 hypothetical protein [Candidatus Caldarchaeum sp.]MDW7977357.1 hypothetical protein [Candidatus Caldarchaeum sp.]MDW8359688.1 hypothetical protein [Candidatus Caldarchaeum sp.]
MRAEDRPPFEVVSTKLGFAVLSDETVIYLRPVIVGIAELGPRMPTGLNLGTARQVGISLVASKQLMEKVADKPQPKEDEHLRRMDIWEFIDIVEKKAGFDLVRYRGSDGLNYLVRLEIEPNVVSRTLEYRDQLGNPIYHVSWSEKIQVQLERG